MNKNDQRNEKGTYDTKNCPEGTRTLAKAPGWGGKQDTLILRSASPPHGGRPRIERTDELVNRPRNFDNRISTWTTT